MLSEEEELWNQCNQLNGDSIVSVCCHDVVRVAAILLVIKMRCGKGVVVSVGTTPAG